MKRTNLSGFTLAEVLITLGIIGVVAAMTLPTIIDNSRNKQLESALKKSFSTLSQALDMYYAEEGVKLTPQNCGGHELKPILMKYIHSAKDCGYAWSETYIRHCLPTFGTSKVKYKTLNGATDYNFAMFDDGQFVINDGSLVLLENMTNGKNLFIFVDVNGYNKRPNKVGIDVFTFQINDKGTLLPMGVKGTTYYNKNDAYCSWTSTDVLNGAGCTYKALFEKDYFKTLPR